MISIGAPRRRRTPNNPTSPCSALPPADDHGLMKVDMIPGDGEDGLLGFIVLESKKYNMTNKRIKLLTLIPACVLLVKDVFSLLMEKGHDRYTFTKEEEGCRFWICTFVKDLEEAEKVPKSSAVDSVRTLSFYWHYPSGSTPRIMEAGTFF